MDSKLNQLQNAFAILATFSACSDVFLGDPGDKALGEGGGSTSFSLKA